jgi:ribosomal protein S19E (S16A)
MNSSRLPQEKFAQKGNPGKCKPPSPSLWTYCSDGRVQRDIKEKEKAIETLSKRYGKRPPRGEKLPATIMGEEEVKQVLYAVGDNHGTLSPFGLLCLW